MAAIQTLPKQQPGLQCNCNLTANWDKMEVAILFSHYSKPVKNTETNYVQCDTARHTVCQTLPMMNVWQMPSLEITSCKLEQVIDSVCVYMNLMRWAWWSQVRVSYCLLHGRFSSFLTKYGVSTHTSPQHVPTAYTTIFSFLSLANRDRGWKVFITSRWLFFAGSELSSVRNATLLPVQNVRNAPAVFSSTWAIWMAGC